METFVLSVLVGLQAKHFVADYLLQPRWMIEGKASFAKPGGYVHVVIHALGSLLILAPAGVSTVMIAALVVAEAVVHYIIDYAKARWSLLHPSDPERKSYWAAHGADQFMHQLTYVVMLFLVMGDTGAA
jgi:hypothetical protein